ncbi:hypothetical protein SE17_02490 [Kouleothrix aurantiaca]|uniref:Uncharacterized protein n=1 Tax=Kouleothrix aurantiaca TaxID=186479 RepID=A0A0P9DMG5_9CHLR|nr:hypothetical protein SE17_02490 [Kouleothrix aurantiaca]
MLTAEQILSQAQVNEVAPTQVAAPQIVYLPQSQRGGSGFMGWLVAGVTLLVAGGVWLGVIDISPVTTPTVATQPTVAVRTLPTSLPVQPQAQAQAQPQAPVVPTSGVVVVPAANANIKFEATAAPATPTTDPNLTRLVAMINSTPTPFPVAGPAECNSANATFHSHTVAVDEHNIPLGKVETWSCESQSAADQEADNRAKAMIAAAKK